MNNFRVQDLGIGLEWIDLRQEQYIHYILAKGRGFWTLKPSSTIRVGVGECLLKESILFH